MNLALQTTPQTARIFLNEARGKHELSLFRSFHSFNFGGYHKEGREPFGNLYLLSDDTLAGGASLQMQAEENTQVLLLPVVGGVNCNGNDVMAGELLSMNVAAAQHVSIRNPYAKENDLVNYLQFWFTSPGINAPYLSQPKSFSLDSKPDQMIALNAGTGFPAMSIGKYRGRKKEVYELNDLSAGVYAFVVQGAFEVEDRLLHERDGLALTGFPSIEFEALSNDAIIILVEVVL